MSDKPQAALSTLKPEGEQISGRSRQAAETIDKVDECKFPYCECSMGAAERCSKGRKGP